ncbi:hypothetical protein U4960_11170 [Altererythrobacter sp. H2]|uniref:hypothetical protein n=1 Tax=Altererythrobacter sp. H2 TaxID=3108391 RepID=UPI002B4BA8D6|nr:hypothetical protein [Altererythrobacter sp. H2]WRK94855.1 hypothetical protein U4960_11170 [Altererythrobacter sp. H2]
MHTAPAPQSRPNAALRRLIWAGAIALLVLPAIAMLFTSEVNWGPEDFVVGGVLLLGTAFVLDRVIGSGWSRRTIVLTGGAVVFVLVFVWAELAVGLIGSPWAGS